MEAEKLTNHIHPMQHKLQGILQLIKKYSLEHVQSDQVEQLAMQAEEVAKIEAMV